MLDSKTTDKGMFWVIAFGGLWETGSHCIHSPGCSVTHYVAQIDLETTEILILASLRAGITEINHRARDGR